MGQASSRFAKSLLSTWQYLFSAKLFKVQKASQGRVDEFHALAMILEEGVSAAKQDAAKGASLHNQIVKDGTHAVWPSGVPDHHHELVVNAAQWAALAYSSSSLATGSVSVSVTTSAAEDPVAATHLPAIKLHDLDQLAFFDSAEYDAQCLVFNAADNMLVVSVRGTQSRENMLVDLAVKQVPFMAERPEVFVHAGFFNQFSALQILVESRVAAHFAAGGTLLCCGHSLGAAVATLLAAYYGHRYPGRVAFVGIGTPRSGNVNFAQLVDETTSVAFCVKNHRDPVCAMVPAVCAPHLYQHVGVSVRVGVDPTPAVANMFYVGDHNTIHYVANLKALL